MQRWEARIGAMVRSTLEEGWIGTITNVSNIDYGYVSVTWDLPRRLTGLYVSQEDVNSIELEVRIAQHQPQLSRIIRQSENGKYETV